MSYLYIPFNRFEQNDNLRQMATRWQAAVAQDRRWKNPPEIKIHMSMQHLLDPVQPEEKVYVLAHGSGTKDYLMSLTTFPSPAISPSDLADRLERDGLPKIHRRVHLFACSDAKEMGDFAQAFKTEMLALGYARIEVFYYEASVSRPLPFSDGLYHKEGVVLELLGNVGIPRFRASDVRKSVP